MGIGGGEGEVREEDVEERGGERGRKGGEGEGARSSGMEILKISCFKLFCCSWNSPGQLI